MILANYIPQGALEICALLQRMGWKAYIVGGALRDIFLQRNPNDFDITTDARPETIKQILNIMAYDNMQQGISSTVYDVGERFGTLAIALPDGTYEVTTFRSDSSYSDARRPDSVTFEDDIVQDLARRDFTVNAIAGDPFSGEIVDPFFGVDDLNNRIIRTVGSPYDRFSEDALRMLRCVRFASVLQFSIEPETEIALANDVLRAQLKSKVSVERIFVELSKMLVGSAVPSHGMLTMLNSGLLSIVVPELMPLIGLEQNTFYHEYDAFIHTMKALDATSPILPVRIAALFHDTGKAYTREYREGHGYTFIGHADKSAELASMWLRRMKVSNEFHDLVVRLIALHDVFYNSTWSDGAIRRFLKKLGPENISLFADLRRADLQGHGDKPHVVEQLALLDEFVVRATEIMLSSPPVNDTLLAISGTDIMNSLGIRPGPMIGKIKSALVEIVTDDPGMNTPENLMMILPELYSKLL